MSRLQKWRLLRKQAHLKRCVLFNMNRHLKAIASRWAFCIRIFGSKEAPALSNAIFTALVMWCLGRKLAHDRPARSVGSIIDFRSNGSPDGKAQTQSTFNRRHLINPVSSSRLARPISNRCASLLEITSGDFWTATWNLAFWWFLENWQLPQVKNARWGPALNSQLFLWGLLRRRLEKADAIRQPVSKFGGFFKKKMFLASASIDLFLSQISDNYTFLKFFDRFAWGWPSAS